MIAKAIYNFKYKNKRYYLKYSDLKNISGFRYKFNKVIFIHINMRLNNKMKSKILHELIKT